jgi:hypothetical protein
MQVTAQVFHRVIFDTPQLTRFISCTPELEARKEARINISHSGVSVVVPGVVGKGLRSPWTTMGAPASGQMEWMVVIVGESVGMTCCCRSH